MDIRNLYYTMNGWVLWASWRFNFKTMEHYNSTEKYYKLYIKGNKIYREDNTGDFSPCQRDVKKLYNNWLKKNGS